MQNQRQTTIFADRRLDLQGLKKLRQQWPRGCQQIALRLNSEQEFTPVGLAGLGCLIGETRRAGGNVNYNIQSTTIKGGWSGKKCFDAMGLEPPPAADLLGNIEESNVVYMPICQEYDVGLATEALKPLCRGASDAYQILRHIISEMGQNICQHSSATGFLALQYIPGTNCLDLVIADFGCGLKTALTGRYNPQDDIEAIKLAIQPGVSTAAPLAGGRRRTNRGVGLSCAHRLIVRNAGVFEIWTGSGEVSHVLFDNRPPVRTPEPWNGTVISCMLPMDNIRAPFSTVMESVKKDLHAAEGAMHNRYTKGYG
jgi:hypothetical protein